MRCDRGFNANVQEVAKAESIVRRLLERWPEYKISFDLSDCDKTLRVDGTKVEVDDIVSVLHSADVRCEWLERLDAMQSFRK